MYSTEIPQLQTGGVLTIFLFRSVFQFKPFLEIRANQEQFDTEFAKKLRTISRAEKITGSYKKACK